MLRNWCDIWFFFSHFSYFISPKYTCSFCYTFIFISVKVLNRLREELRCQMYHLLCPRNDNNDKLLIKSYKVYCAANIHWIWWTCADAKGRCIRLNWMVGRIFLIRYGYKSILARMKVQLFSVAHWNWTSKSKFTFHHEELIKTLISC